MTTGSYKRVGDADHLLTPFEIYELQHRFDNLNTDSEPVPGTSIEDLSPRLVDSVRDRLEDTGSRALAGEGDRWLRFMNVVTESGELTLAGLLALGTYPQQYFQRLFVDVAVHPGASKGTIESARFLDRKLCEGNMLAIMQDALSAIKRNLRVRRVVTDAQGRDYLEIPEDVIRETLANALMHRDYSPLALSSGINVDIYRDRLEITSPGGFPGSKSATPEALLDGHPAPRNTRLARLLMEVPWPGRDGGVLAESNGSGIPRMFTSMQEAGLPVPEYRVDVARVTVTLHRFGLMDPEINEWLRNILGNNFDPTEGIALVLAREFGTVSVTDLQRQTGREAEPVRNRLERLVDEGALAESATDHFRLPTPTDRLTPVQKVIVDSLSADLALSTREIAEATGKNPNTIRPVLRELVEAGLVTPTAPPTSKNRKYLRSEE